MAWEEGLDGEQRAAVSSDSQNVCLLSGPGTGKTRCLTRRVEYLSTDRGIPSSEIVAITFTRAAVASLKEKIRERTDGAGREMEIGVYTLHGFALRQLLRNVSLTSLPQPLRIADDFEERWIVVEEMKNILKRSVKEIKQLLADLSADWETLATEETTWMADNPETAAFLGAWSEHRAVYGYTLRAEMVYQPKRILESRSDFQLEGRIQHIIVDEYQDLNRCELLVIKKLTERGIPLFVAGDDDQSIYGFRNAHPNGIRGFANDYDPRDVRVIETCHRCDRELLRLANFVAQLDPRRAPKALRASEKAEDGLVRLLTFTDQDREALGIAELCAWLKEEHTCLPEDILILLRSDKNGTMSKPIIDALNARGIPVEQVTDPLAPLGTASGTAPGRAMLCALRLTQNPRDHLAWRTWLEIRDNELGERTQEVLYDLARKRGIAYTDVLDQICEDPDSFPLAGKGAVLVEELEYLRRVITDISDATNIGVEQGLRLAADLTIEDESDRQNVLSVFARVRAAIDSQDLGELLRALPVSLIGEEEQAESEERPGAVRIMTMHQAKGLTAKAVIIAAAEDEYIPGRAKGELEIGDARRLLYVSLTRAEHFLFITYCEQRSNSQKYTGRNPGNQVHHLTTFLQHAPITRGRGEEYIARLGK